MQLGDMRAHILDLVGQDSTVSNDAFGTGMVDRIINRECRRLYSRISDIAPEEITKTGTFSTTADTREYNLLTINSSAMSDFQKLHHVEKTISGLDEPVPLVVDRTFQRGRTDVANRLYLRGTATLGFYRTPSQADTITVHYAPVWTELDDDTDDPASTSTLDPILRESFHDIVIDRAVAQLLFSENGNGGVFLQMAEREEQDMISTLKRRRPAPRTMHVSTRITRRGRF